ncbi:hypothetical protein EJ08DRAFT_274777 [Tothia fuscella]|uniref:Uncharacterized protein n=1 Tax=Tothia fuscella TaxID=1048955 RepID=A0A9P4NQ07_9PEZI|nr:hypothetical protein EJ08DRAFT_274777 [Tothia fuscella]
MSNSPILTSLSPAPSLSHTTMQSPSAPLAVSQNTFSTAPVTPLGPSTTESPLIPTAARISATPLVTFPKAVQSAFLLPGFANPINSGSTSLSPAADSGLSTAPAPSSLSAITSTPRVVPTMETSNPAKMLGAIGATPTFNQLAGIVGGVLGGCVVIAIMTAATYWFIRRRRRERMRRISSATSSWGQLDPDMPFGYAPPSRLSTRNYFNPRSPRRTLQPPQNSNVLSHQSRGSSLPRSDFADNERGLAVSHQNSKLSKYHKYREMESNRVGRRNASPQWWPSRSTVLTIAEEMVDGRGISIHELPPLFQKPLPRRPQAGQI